MGKGLFEAMQKRAMNAQKNKYKNMKFPTFSPIPPDPADSLVKEYLMQTQYSELSHLGHWIKNRHLLNELQDDVLDSCDTKAEIISLFGGLKKMVGVILQQMFNLNYLQHQQLFILLTKLNQQYNDQFVSIKSPLISLHESCISIIYTFLNEQDHSNLQRCCTDLAIVGEYKASKASKSTNRSFNSTVDTTYNIMSHFALISQNNILIKRKGLELVRDALSSIHSSKNIAAKYAKLLVQSGYIKHITQTINMKTDDVAMDKEYKSIQSNAFNIVHELSSGPSNRMLLVCDGLVLKELDDFFRANKFMKNKDIFYHSVFTIRNLLDTNPAWSSSLKIESLIQFICSNILQVSWWQKIKAVTLLNKIMLSGKSNVERSVVNELMKVVSILIRSFSKQMDDNWAQKIQVGDTIYFQIDPDEMARENVIIKFEPENECVVLKGEFSFHELNKVKYIKDEKNPQLVRFIDYISHETIVLLSSLARKTCSLHTSCDHFEKGDIVKITGLKSNKCWNDKMGKIVGVFSKSKQRWPVQLMSGDRKLLLKNINVELVSFHDCISSMERIICRLPQFWNRFRYKWNKEKTEKALDEKDENFENVLLDFIAVNPCFMMNDVVCKCLAAYIYEDETHIFIFKKILHNIYDNKFVFERFIQNQHIMPIFQQWLYFDPTDNDVSIVVDIIKLLSSHDTCYILGMMKNLSQLVNGGKSRTTTNDRSIKHISSIHILIENKFWLIIQTLLRSVHSTQIDLLESLYWMLFLMNSVLVKEGNMEFRSVFIDIVCSLVKNETFIKYIHKRLNTNATGRWLSGPGSDPNEHIWDILYYCMSIYVPLCDYIMKEQSFVVEKAITNKKGDNENALRVVLFVIQNCKQSESMDISRLVNVGMIQYLLDYIGMHRYYVLSKGHVGEQLKYLQIFDVLELLLKQRNRELTNIYVNASMLHGIVKESRKNDANDETTNALLSKILLVIKLIEYPSTI